MFPFLSSKNIYVAAFRLTSCSRDGPWAGSLSGRSDFHPSVTSHTKWRASHNSPCSGPCTEARCNVSLSNLTSHANPSECAYWSACVAQLQFKSGFQVRCRYICMCFSGISFVRLFLIGWQTFFYYHELLLQCFVSAVLSYREVFLTWHRRDGNSVWNNLSETCKQPDPDLVGDFHCSKRQFPFKVVLLLCPWKRQDLVAECRSVGRFSASCCVMAYTLDFISGHFLALCISFLICPVSPTLLYNCWCLWKLLPTVCHLF